MLLTSASSIPDTSDQVLFVYVLLHNKDASERSRGENIMGTYSSTNLLASMSAAMATRYSLPACPDVYGLRPLRL